MTERPILFQGAMVRAILDGSKTQTRRVMARQKKYDFTDYTLFGQRGHPDDEAEHRGGWAQPWVAIEHAPDWPDGKDDQCTCPYASERGDRLWVRETWAQNWNQLSDTRMDRSYVYRADGGPRAQDNGTDLPWRPSIHMPRAASRITLEVTEVRVERLQDISEADAIAEGIEADAQPGDQARLWRNYATGNTTVCPIFCYQSLWEKINGPGSWDTNPWVWVVEFRRLA